MQYMGGKTRIAKEILPLILADRKEGQYFVEPFCGGCNVTANVSGNRIANDSNEYLIAMFEGLVSGEKYPEQIDRELYNDVKSCFRAGSDKYDLGFMGWVGFMASYRATFFGGYSGTYSCTYMRSNGEYKDRVSEAVRNITKQVPKLQGVKFRSGDYRNLRIPEESIIYCDPPYMNATGYAKGLDHDEFWQWCRERVYEGHKVYISEYQAPDDFICIWEKGIINRLNTNKKATEKLFIYEGQF
ncbi:DNA adenine methylase [Bacteroides phage BU730P1]|nr:DNA adenine methylase [Bacteroides phage BU730P1]